MKTTRKRVARYIPLLALLLLSPFGLVSCDDAGDEPGNPTGPSTVYNPDVDYSGATIDITPTVVTVAPGESFTVVATYRTADGVAVADAPLEVSSELSGYLGTPVNPVYTDGSGTVSVTIYVDPACPEGSYRAGIGTLPVEPLSGPFAYTTFGIMVTGATGPGITSLDLTASSTSTTVGTAVVFTATATANTFCTPVIVYSADGAGLTFASVSAGTTNPAIFSLNPTTPGTLQVWATASCSEDATVSVVSNAVSVNVSAAP